MEKVSVIIPVYNNEKYIRKCLLSLLHQTYREIEILVIDDGSTDQSAAIAENLAKRDARVCLIRQKNQGVSAARNQGIRMATGEYLTFVDGDDYVRRDYIERFVARAGETGADMVVCGFTCTDEKGRILRKQIPAEYRRWEREEGLFRVSAVWAHFYRRSLWMEHSISFFPGVRGEDLPISLYFAAVCEKIATLDQNGYIYVQHAASARHNFRGLRNYKLPLEALEEVFRKIDTMGCRNSYAFYELHVLRIFTTFYFDLAQGASSEDMLLLCDFIENSVQRYFPSYARNPLLPLFHKTELPFYQRLAVRLFVFLLRTGRLASFSKWIIRLGKEEIS